MPRTVEFPDKSAARGALPGPLGAAANRFFRDATGKSAQFKVTDLEDGRFRFEFFSAARNPGYGKRYVQVVGPTGEIISEYKETLGPEGLIETKWVHGGPAYEDDA
jgi:hypothetical protein